MILLRLKSSIPAAFCNLNRRLSLCQRKFCIFGSITFRIRTRKTENVTDYFAHAQTVFTGSLLGGEGPGDVANTHTPQNKAIAGKYAVSHPENG